MLRQALDARICTLLARLRAEHGESAATAPAPEELVSLVEKQIDTSIERLVVDVLVRAAIRERPRLAASWPLAISVAAPGSEADLLLRRLGELEGLSVQSDERSLVTESLALIAAVEHQVSSDRRRASMAIDAGHPHHSLVGGMRDIPKDGLRKRGAKAKLAVDNGYAQVLAPGCGSVQLRFPIASLNETILETLREWRGSKGLRHWAAMQRLLSVEGGRSGRVTWKLDEHFEALGYSERTCRDETIRRDVAAEVELLTKIELAVYDRNGKLRLRQALFTPILKAERQIEGTTTWALEGLTLEVHPLLYEGVRDPKSGKIGKNWYPQAIEIAKIDDIRFPYAIALGLVLPIRWRWAWGVGKDYCALSGGNLLNMAGVAYDRRRDVSAWSALRRTLTELQRIGALGSYEWVREAETINGTCHLFPPPWAIDRTIRELPPLEKPPERLVANGRELREWRVARSWTQAKLAEELGITERTVRRAEAAPDAELSTALNKRLKELATRSEAPAVPPSKPTFVEI